MAALVVLPLGRASYLRTRMVPIFGIIGMASCSWLAAEASYASASHQGRRARTSRDVGDENQDDASLEELPPGLGLSAELAHASNADSLISNIPAESAVLDEALPLPPPPARPRSSSTSLVSQQRVQVPDWSFADNGVRLRGAESTQKPPTPVAEYDLIEDSPAPPFRARAASHAQRENRRLALSRAAATASRGLTVHQKKKSKNQTPKERMESQCLEYADWVRKQGAQGTEFVRLWTNTCTGGVNEGSATPQYVEMCSSLGGAVADFAKRNDWKAEDVCKAVLQSFEDAGVGATPLVG